MLRLRLLECIEQGERWLKFALFHLVEIGTKHRHGRQRPGMRAHKKGVEPDGVDAALGFAHQQIGLINAFDFAFQTERLSVGSASPEYQRQQKAEKIEELHGERAKEEKKKGDAK